jgi:hypothetical protein
LARLRYYRCHHDEATIAKALHGLWREAHLCALAQAVTLYDMYHQKSGECDRQIEAHLGTFAEPPDREAVLPARNRSLEGPRLSRGRRIF